MRGLLYLLIGAAAIATATPTFNRDVAPILHRHCASCHHAGEVAPFPLITYRDSARWAKLIARVTAKREMPPWRPVHGYGRFEGERRLSDTEIRTLGDWADAGAPEGDPDVAPPAPAFKNNWRLGEPDLVVRASRPYVVPARGEDAYRCFVITTGLDRDRWVRAAEFRPSNRSIVHHALVFIDATHVSRTLDEHGDGYSCFGTPGFLPSGALGGWSPGSGPLEMYPGTAVRLPRGASLVVQEHFHPKSEAQTEQASIGLYFTDQAPTRSVADVGLVSRNIDIAPGERSYKVHDHFVLPVDVHAVGIIPHAHYICKDVKGWATLPSGQRVWLIWIDNWDFDEQEQYRYADPVALPTGTRVEMEFTYDNSVANPHNPSLPPKRVTWGASSTDEMAGLHIQVIPDRQTDLPELGRALWGKIMRMVGGRFYQTPSPPENR
jgi:hypothetical protein